MTTGIWLAIVTAALAITLVAWIVKAVECERCWRLAEDRLRALKAAMAAGEAYRAAWEMAMRREPKQPNGKAGAE